VNVEHEIRGGFDEKINNIILDLAPDNCHNIASVKC
jgi:hypothetical protein